MKRYVFIGMLTLVTTIGPACAQPEATPSPTPTIVPPPQPTALLNQVNAAMAAVDGVHLDGDVTVKASKNSETELITASFTGDANSVGDRQAVFTMTFTIGSITSTVSIEAREVARVNYMKNPITGEWEVDEDYDPSESSALQAAILGRLSLDGASAGLDSLNGVPVYRLSGGFPEEPEVEQLVLWVRVEDLLILQIQEVRHEPATEFEGIVPPDLRVVYVRSIFRLSKFNEPVMILAPER